MECMGYELFESVSADVSVRTTDGWSDERPDLLFLVAYSRCDYDRYPVTIPPLTSIPSWAYADIVAADNWNVDNVHTNPGTTYFANIFIVIIGERGSYYIRRGLILRRPDLNRFTDTNANANATDKAI